MTRESAIGISDIVRLAEASEAYYAPATTEEQQAVVADIAQERVDRLRVLLDDSDDQL
ncbi:hypothetical protein [Streptomyces griseus]|uniref:hypothetical protein n=1 Tax=Streptomyces griseus TaxID=1911 RepID=UPI0033C5B111